MGTNDHRPQILMMILIIGCRELKTQAFIKHLIINAVITGFGVKRGFVLFPCFLFMYLYNTFREKHLQTINKIFISLITL
jgi:hypothetical protein